MADGTTGHWEQSDDGSCVCCSQGCSKRLGQECETNEDCCVGECRQNDDSDSCAPETIGKKYCVQRGCRASVSQIANAGNCSSGCYIDGWVKSCYSSTKASTKDGSCCAECHATRLNGCVANEGGNNGYGQCCNPLPDPVTHCTGSVQCYDCYGSGTYSVCNAGTTTMYYYTGVGCQIGSYKEGFIFTDECPC